MGQTYLETCNCSEKRENQSENNDLKPVDMNISYSSYVTPNESKINSNKSYLTNPNIYSKKLENQVNQIEPNYRECEETQDLKWHEKKPKKIQREVSFGISNQNSNQRGQEMPQLEIDNRNSAQYGNSQYSISSKKPERLMIPQRSSSPGYFPNQSTEYITQSPESSNFNTNAINSNYYVKTKNYLNNKAFNNEQFQQINEATENQVNLTNYKQSDIQQFNSKENKIDERNLNELQNIDYNKYSQIADNEIITNINQQRTVSNYILSNGAVYKGQMIGKIRDGIGEQVWPDGAKYIGSWKNDKANGMGKFIHPDGDIYEGLWLNDKVHGHGIYIGNKYTYDGEWTNDEKHGFGTEKLQEGSNYTGYFEFGVKNGKGLYNWKDGSSYDGNWSNNKMNGYGVYIWPDKKKYAGNWKNNKMEGKGKFYWPNGKTFVGEFLNDSRHGYGICRYSDKSRYEGSWKNNLKEGEGKLFSNGKIKVGIWKKGELIQVLEEYDEIDNSNSNSDSDDLPKSTNKYKVHYKK